MILDIMLRSGKVDPKHPRDPGLVKLFGMGTRSDSGIEISEDDGFKIDTAYACISTLSETIAMLPLNLYNRDSDRGKSKAIDDPHYRLLKIKPNRYQTTQEFLELQMCYALTNGNCYAHIIYDNAGNVRELLPLHAPNVMPFWDPNGKKSYAYNDKNGRHIFLPDEVLHIMGKSSNMGLSGLSPIESCMQTFGIARAAERYGARFFGNDTRPGGYLKHPGQLSSQAKESLKESWERRHSGTANSHRLAVLEEGLEFQEVGINPDQAQFLETRKFQRQQIAAIFKVPPHMVGIMDNASFSNIEHQGQEFLTYSLLPWITRWEQALTLTVLSEQKQKTQFIKFNTDAIIRGDIKTRYDAYTKGRQWGWLSANDIREKEDMNPLPDDQGDKYLTPLNMSDAAEVESPENQTPERDDIDNVDSDDGENEE